MAWDQPQLRAWLRTWDNAKPNARKKLLSALVAEICGLTGPELETFFSNGASLVLARISAWLRLTYLNPKNFISVQLRAVSVFVGATGGQRFLVEFMEVGGALTVMEILQLPYATEDDLAAAMELLLAFADAGPKFKESLCQSGAIGFVADCLVRVARQTSRQAAHDLLYQLALGNMVYQNEVIAALVAMLPTAPSGAQMAAAQILRLVIPTRETVDASVVDPVLSLLGSLELQVQYEGSELLKEFIKFDEIKELALAGLVKMLKSTELEGSGSDKAFFNLQQAAASKTIGVLCAASPDLVRPFVQLQAIHGLLVAMANTKHVDSQIQALGTLNLIYLNSYGLADAVKESVGADVFDNIKTNGEAAFGDMPQAQVDALRDNTFHLDDGDERMGPGGAFFGSDL